MIFEPDCDLLNPNMTECDGCYRYDICRKASEIEDIGGSNMNEYIYIFISVTDIDKITTLKIIATNEKQALSKAYSYFGGDIRLPIEDFNILVEHTSIERIYKLFKDFTGQTILYFCEETDTGIIDDLQEIDIIKCQ